MQERPLKDVPWVVLAALALGLLLQIALRLAVPERAAAAQDLDKPPPIAALRLAALGDSVPLAKLMMLYLQSYDLRAGNPIHYQSLDYDRLIAWLKRIIELDPLGQYPLNAASRIYAETGDTAKQRKMLEFVYQEFLVDPERRWPWLAQAASVAKHQLHDLPLARRYAAVIQLHAKGPRVPLWARQMEAFILEDMNELEAARIMIGSYVASGQVTEAGEMRFLEDRLKQIESKLKAQEAGQSADMPSASRRK